MKHVIGSLLILTWSVAGYTWNAVGHKLVAQIAYDNLCPTAKRMSHKYLSASQRLYANPDFIMSSIWLDIIKKKGVHQFDSIHYIDLPFSQDNTYLPLVAKPNALSAIIDARKVLLSNHESDAKKGLSLRILIHLIGDIHQPLHTVMRVSKKLPKGDLGGNLFNLTNNPYGRNLHQYWDNGAGLLMSHGRVFHLKRQAKKFEKKWSCNRANKTTNPKDWINESHQLALKQVYTIDPYHLPSRSYNKNARYLVEKQIIFAGCRLAYLLNSAMSVK